MIVFLKTLAFLARLEREAPSLSKLNQFFDQMALLGMVSVRAQQESKGN